MVNKFTYFERECQFRVSSTFLNWYSGAASLPNIIHETDKLMAHFQTRQRYTLILYYSLALCAVSFIPQNKNCLISLA